VRTPIKTTDTAAIRARAGGRRGSREYLPGLVLIVILATCAMKGSNIQWCLSHGISALTLAIVLGMLVGNTLYPRVAGVCATGVGFSKQTLLRSGIILYGLRLTFQDIARVGIVGVLIDCLVVSSTFALACWLGTRVFGLDRKTAMLIGAGSAICGAAAVLATEPVVSGRVEQVAIAVSSVVVFGTVAIFLYPALYHFNDHYHVLAMSPSDYGLFAGSTVHEVAQVVAAGRAISDSAANTAVITKMVRVMMLAPFLMILSAIFARGAAPRVAEEASAAEAITVQKPSGGIMIPWFAFGFVAVVALHSMNILPKAAVDAGILVDTIILAMAMAALGITTHASAVRTAGIKAMALGLLLFAWLIVGGFAINAGISAAFR
jgi:uncharacterized integral membrane protein (TIGR00698 family)